MLAGRRCEHLQWHGDLLIVQHHWQHSYLCACSRSKVPIAPMGKWLTCLPRLSLAQLQPTLWSTTGCACRRGLEKFCPDGKMPCPDGRLIFCLLFAGRRCVHRRQWHGELLNVHHHRQYSWFCACSRSKLPIAPMGKCLAPMGFSHVLRLCLQGGGVFVESGTVSFLSCTITGNSATYVRAQLKTSHRPDGILTCFARVLAGWRCVHRRWHGDLLIVHHHWQHSYLCACSRTKFPIAPMGFSHVLRLCLQGGGVTVWGGTMRSSPCHR